MKMANQRLVRALVLGTALAGGITLAQSFYNEAQGSTPGQTDKVIRECMYRAGGSMHWGTTCYAGGSNCSYVIACGQ